MGDRSRIEWTDATWNPVVGCSKASAGCDNCYAIRVAHRGMAPQHRGLTVVPEGTTTPEWNGQVNLVPTMLDQPLRWGRPRRIFVNSLSDLWHPEVPLSFIEEVFATMALAPRHVFQLLTKRPARQATVLGSDAFPELVAEAIGRMEGPAAERARAILGTEVPWPLPNVWVGTSVEDNRVAWRADHLRRTPAAVRWISAEPMIGPLDQLDLEGIDWMVAGGESGPGARPLHPEWVRDLRDRCVSRCSGRCGASFSLPLGAICEDHNPRRGPAFHFKQWGDWCPAGPLGGAYQVPAQAPQRELDEDDPEPVFRVGKKAAGRELAGRTWDEWPAGHETLAGADR